MDGHKSSARLTWSRHEPLNHTPEIQVLKRNMTLPEEFTWPSKSKTQKVYMHFIMPGHAPDWLFKYGTCSRLHIRNVIYKHILCLTCRGATSIPWDREKHALESYFTQTSPETTWFDKKKNADEVRQEPRQAQKEPGLIKKEPRQGTAGTKTNPERTRIDHKTTPKRCCKYQDKFRKNPDWSENNPDKVHTSSERTWTKCKQPGRGTSRTREV